MMQEIAFVDSGIGGLPYLSALREKLPQAPIIYVADNKNFPYGSKDETQIRKGMLELVASILKRYNPSLLVVACNTASVVALETLRSNFSVPFVGIVPAVKPAAIASKTRSIGVLATERTIKGDYLEALITKYANDCRVTKVAASELISLIEKDPFIEDPLAFKRLFEEARVSFERQSVDTVVLGCTHFLHVAKEFEQYFANRFTIMDSRDGVVNQTLRIIESLGLMQGYESILESDHTAKQLFLSKEVVNSSLYQRVASRYGLSFGGII